MSASFAYSEPAGQCVLGRPVAAFGFATGSYQINAPGGSMSGGFQWARVGTVAVVVSSFPTGVGVAQFVPPIDTCSVTTAFLAGVAVVE